MGCRRHWDDMSLSFYGITWAFKEDYDESKVYSLFTQGELYCKDIEVILQLLIYDKKNSHGKIKFCLLNIGTPQWDVEVPDAIQ